MADVLQEAFNAARKRIVEDNGLRLASQPKIELPAERDAVDAALEARGDLNFTVALELLPNFDIGDLSPISLERPVADVEEAEVDRALRHLADSRRVFTERPEGEKAEIGDRLTVDFVGAIAGEPFEGGASQNIQLILGSNTFIPGFEDALVGAVAGERRTVQATFPENYASRALAGKTPDFDVTIKSVAAPAPLEVDDEFAKTTGQETIEGLRGVLRAGLASGLARASRDKLKRKLLDALAAHYHFDVPEALVDKEFAQIWTQVEKEQKESGRSFEDDGATEEGTRAEYRRIAERRVRLGLLIAEIALKAEVNVSDEEMRAAVIARARSFPGQEKQVWDFYHGNAEARAELRAPLLEEKVVDHILSLVKVEDVKVSSAELLKADEDETLALEATAATE
jgi:trigger factor